MRVHAVDMRVVHDAVEVQGEGTEGGIVRVGETVDNSVKGVTADDVIIMLWG